MISELQNSIDTTEQGGSSPPLTGWRFFLHYARRVARGSENLLVCFVLAAMTLLLIFEIILRVFFKSGVVGSATTIQNFTLLTGVFGGMLAARDNRLLSLSTTELFKGKIKIAATILSSIVGVTVCFWLTCASIEYVKSELPSGSFFPFGLPGSVINIPRWYLQSFLGLGFAIICLRLLWHSAEFWLGRCLTLLVAAGLIYFTYWVTVSESAPEFLYPENWKIAGIITLILATLLGLPIFALLGGLALLLFWASDNPIACVTVSHYELVTNAMFPSIPLFTLAGYFLAESGSSKRLIVLFQALFGWLRGGPAIVTVAVCAFFTSFTGASGVTILALAPLLYPVLVDSGYQEKSALGLLTGAGSLGMLLPPCLPVILYAIIAEVQIRDMFLAGIIPGLLLVVMTGCWGVWKAPADKFSRQIFNLRKAGSAIWQAKWEIMIPVVALTGIFGGFATPVEAAALTAFYTFIVEVCIYRDLKIFKDLPRVMSECGLLVGGVLLILGVALGFTDYLIDAQIPAEVVTWVKASIKSKYVFLLCLNLLLIIVGCLMDVFSATIVMVPLLLPLGREYGISELHLGIIFLANLELGYLTPPIGMNLFLSSYRFKKPVMQVARAIVPILLVQLVAVILITYLPFLTTFLPSLFAGK